METVKSLRLGRVPFFVAGAVALLDALSIVLMWNLDGFGSRWWSLAHRPMSELLIGIAIGGGVEAHDPLRWNEIVYFALNVVYLAVAAFLLSLLACRLWPK